MADRRVVLFGLGGTIAMVARAGGGVAPALTPDQLLAAVPGLADTGIAVDVVDFRQVPGASVTAADLRLLVPEIAERLAGGADGVVITQGTDTIEEAAYLLDLGHAGPAPIVVTGAMRNPTMAGADGPANLLAAIQVAAAPSARDLGVLVVFADEIHAARRVRKTHTTSGATFRSRNGGPLGYVVEGTPRLLNRLDHRTVVPPGDQPARVAVVTVTFDDDGVLLDGLADRVDGVVLAALGAGHVPATLIDKVTDLAARRPVVLASRTGAGSILAGTYGFPGSERDLLAKGLISAGFLDPFKARLLLQRSLAAGADRPTITAAIGVAGGYRDPADWPWPAR
ncbi:MAG TPA: asparaginase [Pseudonocardiaceae bacterium]|nr:asparaginase [Pseudonocardiaceae bacterium]